jgi:hypothetical protein
MDILPVLRRAILGRLDWRGISRVILAGNIDKVEGLRKLYVSVILPQMNPCSVENRTRTYQPARRISAHLEFDEQFESQLPPEVRVELETATSPVNRCEKEIQQALSWLKTQGFLQEPTPPAPPPQVLIRPAPVSPPAKPAESTSRRGTGIWRLLATLIGLPLLLARVADKTPPQSRPLEVRRALPAVEVRRALPAVPRALPVSAPALLNAGWQSIRMPDGSSVQAFYQGQLPSSAALPAQGQFIGEEYLAGTTRWIWLQPAGASFPSWVDP